MYGWEPAKKNKDEEVEPGYAYTLRITDELKPNHVNLIIIGDEVKHYYLVKHFSSLVSAQYLTNGHEFPLLPLLPPWICRCSDRGTMFATGRR